MIAQDHQLRNTVALKVLKAHLLQSADIVSRQRDEARLLAQLDHPSIVRVYELLEAGGRLVVVMEALTGASIEHLLRTTRGGLPVAEALLIVQRVAEALDAAYHTKVGPSAAPLHTVHRDIKPSNLILTVEGSLKVVDFGLAKGSFEGRETVTMARVLGSRGYMSPERMDGQPDTPKGDVYALGLSLFEFLTGKSLILSVLPHKHQESLTRSLRYLPTEGLRPVPLSQTRELLRTMCAYEPEERPSHTEVAEAIRDLLPRLGPAPNLRGLAQLFVTPLVDARTLRAPQEHPAWGEVAFLQGLTSDGAPTDLSSEARARQVLQRSTSGRWKFWSRSPSNAELIEALLWLPPGDQEVRAWARGLLSHEEEAVRDGARALLARR